MSEHRATTWSTSHNDGHRHHYYHHYRLDNEDGTRTEGTEDTGRIQCHTNAKKGPKRLSFFALLIFFHN